MNEIQCPYCGELLTSYLEWYEHLISYEQMEDIIMPKTEHEAEQRYHMLGF